VTDVSGALRDDVDARSLDERPEDRLIAAPADHPIAVDAAAPDPVAEEPPPAVSDPSPVEALAERYDDRPVELVTASGGSADARAAHPHPATNGHTNGHAEGGPGGCTPAQMRRFIKSRPWIPMHELRRRFGINGHEDDVTPVAVGPRTLFVGLPEREGRMLGELLRGGDVGYELSVDPDTPIVIGVFPMRPIARP
jgi:hypothetical protein